ncbi:MAG: S66 peptidase family protein [Candidatus Paceibacterota bacterium]
MYPPKLKKEDEIRVVAPSCSLSIIADNVKEIANQRLGDLGFKVTFGKDVSEIDEFRSSSIKSRISDIHKAFSNKKVKAVFAVIGGMNSNQLLRYLDWDLIKNNPKIFIGYSDTTALENAIFAKTGLVTYSGPAYSTFGQKKYFDYTLENFKKCLMNDEEFEIKPSEKWSDDSWYKNQEKRRQINNEGWWIINKGKAKAKAKGTILGSNLCTLNLLQGTEYFPKLNNSILFLEDDSESGIMHFECDLQSLIHLPDFKGVKGIIIGRFQKESKVTKDKLTTIIKNKKELKNIPVIANVDFGHTSPIITFPIGGEVEIDTNKRNIIIKKH